MRITEVNTSEGLRICDHDASSVAFKQPVPLRIASEAFNDQFDRAGVASVRPAIP